MNSTQGSTSDNGALLLDRVFDAPPEAVFALWSDPARIQEWWHPKDFRTPHFEMDFRVGGSYRYSIRSKSQENWAHGQYREIEAPRRIVMTFQWEGGEPDRTKETLITLGFEPEGEGRTRFTFRQEPFASDAERHSHGQGWNQVLDAFVQSLAGAAP